MSKLLVPAPVSRRRFLAGSATALAAAGALSPSKLWAQETLKVAFKLTPPWIYTQTSAKDEGVARHS